MSNLQNDELLENLFEEAKLSLYRRGMHFIFSKEEIEECATETARYKFDEYAANKKEEQDYE